MMRTAKLFASALALGGMATMAHAASDTGFGGVADTVRTGLLGPIGDLLGAAGLILGIGSLVMAGVTIFRMKSHHGDPNATPATVGRYMIAGILLLALPATMGTGVATLFGSGADTASIDGTLQSVN